jgi:hypothetical protein
VHTATLTEPWAASGLTAPTAFAPLQVGATDSLERPVPLPASTGPGGAFDLGPELAGGLEVPRDDLSDLR